MKNYLAKGIVYAVGSLMPFLASAQTTCTLNGRNVPCDSEGMQAVGAVFGIGFILLFIAIGIVALLATVFWIWMIVHAATKSIDNKALWIILMIILGFPVALVYYFVVKRNFDGQAQTSPIVPANPTTPDGPAKIV